MPWYNSTEILSKLIPVAQILIVLLTIFTIWASVQRGRLEKHEKSELSTRVNQTEEITGQLSEDKNRLESEIKQKQKKIDELEKLAKKDIYKPLSEVVKLQLVQNLKTAKGKNIKKILISSFDTNNNGKRVINDLMQILKDAGIDASIERTGMSFGRGVSIHRVKMNQTTVESAEYLCEILSVYLKTKYNGAVDNKLEDGVIDMEFHGIPLFHEDGSVEFQ